MVNKFREFVISSWAIDNRTTIFLLTLVIGVIGLTSYQNLPKENFPEIQWPVIYVSVPYPGTSPEDIEKLICKKIEKEIQGIKGIKEINSTAIQDFGNVFVEFETDIDLKEAKRNVQEAVDRAKKELPNDLPDDPQVMDINLSEIPIMFVNLSGPFDKVALKEYAEDMQDEIEDVREILRVDVIGALEKEVQVDLDLYRMQSAFVSFGDVENAIMGENVIISGGEVDINQQKVAVRVNGEFENVEQISNLVVKSSKGNALYLRDIATVTDGFKEQESYARLDGEPVITLNVVKKANKNLVEASDKIKVLLEEYKEEKLPESLTITIAQDQSQLTRNTLNELTNTIIIGFILVTLVLMFFMGVRDAMFVGLAVPISSLIAFAVIPSFGFTLNLVVLFTFILAMGIVVDNAIVVIENTYRIFNDEGLPIVQAAKKAAGEVIGPVFSGTLTTIAPFLPLLFWKGSVGEFMKFLPITMIITLFASLFVAYVINPVFAVQFMKRNEENKGVNYKSLLIFTGIAVLLMLAGYAMGSVLLGNLIGFVVAFVWFNAFVLRHVIRWFQMKFIPRLKSGYRSVLSWSLANGRPGWVLLGMVVFLIGAIMIIGNSNIKTVYFPESDPNFVYVYNEMPVGTNVEVTDSITRILEDRVYNVLGEDNPDIRSVITNVAIGAGDANSFDQGSPKSNKSKITVEFVQFKDRTTDMTTRQYLEAIRKEVRGIPGTQIIVDQEASGPPTGAPVEIQLTSEDFETLMRTSKDLMAYLNEANVAGVEELKSDADAEKSEIIVNIDRIKASELGVSTGQIGMALRTAVFGKEVTKFRPKGTEDEYPIQIRLADRYRDDVTSLLNMNINFRDQASGNFMSIPISAVADVSYSTAYGGINRTDLEKSVTITSNILDGYNPTEVNAEVEYWITEFRKKYGISSEISITQGGETQEQAEEGAFLAMAFGASILLIFMILVTQFNSLISVMVILFQVVLSVIGAMLGVAVSGMDFSVIMSGVGMVALTGIVVNNGIILLDFIQIMQKEGYSLREAVVEGGAVRFTPVLLTASSTILGLVPLAVSMNINFETLITRLDPQLFFGGDSAAFWGPLSWTIIFGLTFATVVTLVLVPVMYYTLHKTNNRILRAFGVKPSMREEALQDPEADPEAEEAQVVEGIPEELHASNGNGNGHKHAELSGKSSSDEDLSEEKPVAP